PVPVERSPRDEIADALGRLRATRERRDVLALRGLLWRSVGAGEGETLDDALRRPAAKDPLVRTLLRSAEHAAFANDEHFQPLVHDLIDATERYLQ
ncbi:MAG: hypothetical protein M3R35_08790, partial [Candidatus Eremiobacteraeota bacterium]|nr:hypothetical protein [Candidatus Eremiobacteraeota bacterium]